MTRELALLKDGAAELGIELDGTALGRFSLFAAELAKWNRKINLTAITASEDVMIKHFLDSLTILARVDLFGRLLDIGSGGGFPGIPLKIAKPELEVVSVDAVEKKILFQRHVARLLNFNGFTAIHARGESLVGKYPSSFDIIVSRAFTDIVSFVRMVRPLLAAGGRIVAMKGSEGVGEMALCENELSLIGVEVETVHEFGLPLAGDRRSLIIMRNSGGSR